MPKSTYAKQQKRNATPFGWKCTKMLDKAIQQNITKPTRHLLVQWALTFDAMPVRLKVSKDRIIKTLQWFCDNMGGQFTPKASSPATFREKFLQIETAMRRQSEMTLSSGALDHQQEINQMADEVIANSGNLIWPGAEKEQELSFVQISLASYAKFLTDLNSHLARLRRIVSAQSKHQKRLTDRIHTDKASESILERFTQGQIAAQHAELEFFVSELPFDPVVAITSWLCRVYRFARKAEDWDGHLLGRVWQRRHRWVVEDCRQIMRRWDCDNEAFDRLMKELEKLYG